jgi:hypothetical protein
MKTLKLAIVTAMITYSMVSLGAKENKKTRLRHKMVVSFENAVQIPSLVMALYQQIDASLPFNKQYTIIASVILEETLYLIPGSYDQWKQFFALKWQYLSEERPFVISPN